ITYLDLRQHTALKLPTLPKPLVGVISQQKFKKSRAYSIDKSRLHFAHKVVTMLMDSSFVLWDIALVLEENNMIIHLGHHQRNYLSYSDRCTCCSCHHCYSAALLFKCTLYECGKSVHPRPFVCGHLFNFVLALVTMASCPIAQVDFYRFTPAYTYGFFKKKWIVLCDTLLKQSKDDEIVALIAHELGHLKLNHTTYSFIAAQMRASSVSDGTYC
ncbi:hypothetical protein RD792_010680, partial [Penstemon davidsonii]